MRTTEKSKNGHFRVKVISGTRTILMALTCEDEFRKGLLGFSFYREDSPGKEKWLPSQKVFGSIVPDPKAKIDGRFQRFSTEQHPIQSFLWSDYTAEPGSKYVLTIHPRYGTPKALTTDPDDIIKVPVQTEPEHDAGGHSIWFNRGAIAGQHFAKEFGNIKPSSQQLDDLTQPATKWLSRGLAEACRDFIDEMQSGQGLRACVYEFTYKPILNALKAALDRGVDVKICYHATPANENAIEEAEIPKTHAGKKVLCPRTVPKIPHNKFILHIENGKATSVWTGSTNITSSGFLGQTNVGHRIDDPTTAGTYLDYWLKISHDPDVLTGKDDSTGVTPHPPELIPPDSIYPLFSPRHRATMLSWYANRMIDATESIMFTAAFGVNEKFVLPLAEDRDFLRFVLMEKRPAKDLQDRLRADRDVIISYGAVLGEYVTYEDKKRVTKRIPKFGLDEWFEQEEHYRKAGNIFYIHTKFLLVDPLSDDPLICTGSANFSDNSLTQNDENMLLIRGSTRVADIYLTEFDRIFRHFYFRDVANEIELKGKKAEGAFLSELTGPKDQWTDSYFRKNAFKTRRREMFFAKPARGWADQAAGRAQDETSKEGDLPTGRIRPGKAQKATKSVKKSPAKKVGKKVVKKTKATKRPAAKN